MSSNYSVASSYFATMMIRVRRLLPVLLGFASLAQCHATAANAGNQRDLARQRQDIIDAILTSDRPESVARQRWACLSGNEPQSVREARIGGGFDFTPDASDSCLAALQRKGKDQALLEAYKKLLVNHQGTPERYDKLPKAIGAAVLSGDGKVSIGNGRGLIVDAALAFDAGFTVAYMSGAAKKEGEPQKLKAFAEGCLDEKKDAATCFSVGFALGSQAINAQ